MTAIDDSILREFIEESLDHLSGIEDDLLQIETDGANIDDERVNKVFRAVHSIKGGAGFLSLQKITRLCHAQENILNLVRKKELVPHPDVTSALLSTLDTVKRLLQDVENMDGVDIEPGMVILNAVLGIDSAAPKPIKSAVAAPTSLPIKSEDPSQIDAESIRTWRRKGFWVYSIKVDSCEGRDFSKESVEKFIFNLQNTGEVLSAKPGLEEMQAMVLSGQHPCPVRIAYATVLDKEMLSEMLHLPVDFIGLLEADVPVELMPAAVEPVFVQPIAPVAQTQNVRTTMAEPTVVVESTSTSDVGGEKIKVSLGVLDNLMALAGELVLARNQLLQNLESKDASSLEKSAQQVNFITSELQMAIMSTRMQPVGNVFGKFKRIVRDLSKKLDKEIQLFIAGEEVELDKTIIESIGDPLTHIIRNSVDHGIEMPAVRVAAGKPAQGSIHLVARHEAGQVVIEIVDDGKGIDGQKVKIKAIEKGIITAQAAERMSDKELVALVFHPGFSMAEKVTDISGRGVGMDVVNTNFARLGGTVDIQSKVGEGTTLQIKLPLTLAIIPGLMVKVSEQTFAVPQVNLQELVRIAPDQIKKRVQKVGNAVLLRLRDELLPLFSVREVLDIHSWYVDKETGVRREDKRQQFWDRRRPDEEVPEEIRNQRSNSDRRSRMGGSVNIAVVVTGNTRYGLVVDSFLDTEEVVVKPLGAHMKELALYAGATILGDGKPALILDIRGIAEKWLTSGMIDEAKENAKGVAKVERDTQSLLIVSGGEGQYFAAPLGLISRIEMFPTQQIELVSGRKHIQYRGEILPLFSVDEVAKVKPLPEQDHYYAIIYKVSGKEVGLIVSEIVDTVDTDARIDETAYQQIGIIGTAIIDKRTTFILDLFSIVVAQNPEWGKKSLKTGTKEHKSVLVVDDSLFFRGQIQKFVEEAGYTAIIAEDGIDALAKLKGEGDSIGLILTDIEMPNMDGLAFTRKVRELSEYRGLPIVAITSLVGYEAEKRGIEAGVSEYMVKLDRERIVERVDHYLRGQ